MICTTCYRANPTGATRCYNCGARLVARPEPSFWSATWNNDDPDPWTGPDADRRDRYEIWRPEDTAYTQPARGPDAIYNPDGTLAMEPRPFVKRARRGARWSRLFAPLLPILYLLSKLKFLLVFAKFGKIGLTAVTMLISVVTYAWAFGLGWAAAIGFVLLLFVHEMGHWVVMRIKGVPASAPVFIPFLGAVIGMRGMPRSVKDEAEIGIAGPIAGTAGALGCLGLTTLYGGHLWPFLAYIGLFLNLFNLIPVSPLDGGRVVAAISRWLWPIGLVGLLVLFVLRPNPFLLFVALIGGIETIARFRGRYAPTSRPGYYDVTTAERIMMGVLYFGLIALIAVAMVETNIVAMSY